jgi:membrane protease YdiL (CAAX protease family)
MRGYFLTLSITTEFLIVVLGAFGLSCIGSIDALIIQSAAGAISEAGLWSTVVYELCILLALGIFLSMRGWTFKALGVTPAWKDSLIGLPLLGTAYAAYFALWLAFGNAIPGANDIPEGMITSDLQMPTVVLTSIVNGFFEEIFVCGYVIAVLSQRRSATFAVNVSIAIRATYHLYQGPFALLSIVPLGLVFGHWFARTKRLWPVIIAHVLADAIALGAYAMS